ncbi:unnamed protein product [Absidia cylindrospora]
MTIKFQKNNLKQTIERRKKNAKLKEQINRRKDRRLHGGYGAKKPDTDSATATPKEQPDNEKE